VLAAVCAALGAPPRRLLEISFSRVAGVADRAIFSLSGAQFDASGKALQPLPSTTNKPGADVDARLNEAEERKRSQLEDMRRRMGVGMGAAGAAAGGASAVAADATAGLAPPSGISPRASDAAAAGAGKGAAKPAGAAAFPSVPQCDVPLAVQAVDLTACNDITDESLAFLGANCPDLSFLRLRLCDQPAVSDAGVVAVAQGCPNLLAVDLRGCAQLTNISVTALARHCGALERLCLASCSAVDDAGVGVLASARCASSLVDLDLTRCSAVTAAAVQHLITKAPNLARTTTDGVLNLTLCSAIKPEEMAALIAQFPAVRFVRTLHTQTDASKPALVPTFQPPPKEEAFASRRNFSVYGKLGAAAGKKKKK
jgi:hypothetical protein